MHVQYILWKCHLGWNNKWVWACPRRRWLQESQCAIVPLLQTTQCEQIWHLCACAIMFGTLHELYAFTVIWSAAVFRYHQASLLRVEWMTCRNWAVLGFSRSLTSHWPYHPSLCFMKLWKVLMYFYRFESNYWCVCPCMLLYSVPVNCARLQWKVHKIWLSLIIYFLQSWTGWDYRPQYDIAVSG